MYDNKNNLDVLFFVSTVVFSHDAPQVTGFILKIWFVVLSFFGWLKKLRVLNKFRGAFDRNIGDLRDDINDSWGARVNRLEADRVLDFLFELQNPANPAEALNVVILSGDIHTPGYSTIYSADPGHQAKAVIPHIVATPVAYSPLHWLGEAIFRHLQYDDRTRRQEDLHGAGEPSFLSSKRRGGFIQEVRGGHSRRAGGASQGEVLSGTISRAANHALRSQPQFPQREHRLA